MYDVINHSDFQNPFKVLMTFITKSESCMSRVESESKCVDFSPSPTRLGLESDSSPSPRTRVPISANMQ